MNNYFRITAYHPEKNISAIMDSNGLYPQIWQFSAELVKKGFKVIAVGNESKFQFGDVPRAEEDKEHIILRACGQGEPIRNGNTIEVNGKKYQVA